MREIVKTEVLKLLHAGIIYPVPHSEWVSPIQVVSKIIGWRMCIDYQKLNKATKKDHFPLPFINKMLE
jgi:general stress protein CsbA